MEIEDNKIFIEYLNEYFKTNYYFLVDDKIKIDDINYSLFLEYERTYYSATLSPSFEYDCGKEQNIKIVSEDDLSVMLKELKERMKNIHIYLYALDTCDTTQLSVTTTHQYNARLKLLEYLNCHNICYVCREPCLNTEHPRGCSHTIHFKCLYQVSIKLKSNLYTCGICKQQISWNEILEK
jgi:hypothetical protein